MVRLQIMRWAVVAVPSEWYVQLGHHPFRTMPLAQPPAVRALGGLEPLAASLATGCGRSGKRIGGDSVGVTECRWG